MIHIWDQKAAVDCIKDKLTAEQKKLSELQGKAEKILEAADMQKFNVPGYGTISRVKNYSVKVPKDPDLKQKLFDYIAEQKGEDVLFNMTSINSATLNAFYKEERGAAIERQQEDWELPGVGEPEVYYRLGMRKG